LLKVRGSAVLLCRNEAFWVREAKNKKEEVCVVFVGSAMVVF
jgi:hypothetical protein